MGKMKFERRAARQERKNPQQAAVIEVKPVEETVTVAAGPKVDSPKISSINPLEQIARYVKSMDIPRVRAMARRAAAAGTSDDDIQSTIDAALPEAHDLPLHHLAAVASLASDQKRLGYLPFFEQHLAGDHSGELKEFLRSIVGESDENA